MNSSTRALFAIASQVGQDYYPETMGNLFIVNAPMLFSGIWKICKGFLDEVTRKKIKILGGTFLPTLLQHADEESIPSFLGGKCTCSEYEGGCLRSYAGPWNDFELTSAGIRDKKMVPIAYEEQNESSDSEEEVALKPDEEQGSIAPPQIYASTV